MIQISLPYIYKLSSSLRPLRALARDTSVTENLYTLYTAENALNAFLTQSVYSSALRATNAPGMELLDVIRKIAYADNKEKKLDFLDIYNLSNGLEQFETVLTAEMNVGNAFWVTKKRGYDTFDLIFQAEVIFPARLIKAIPECHYDVREAGRCIAFELGTAAGFHTMRALELVLRRYWDAVTNSAPRPTTNNMGDYLVGMEKLKVGTKKVIATLRQIKNLHRNELMHPEETLTLDQAIGLLNIAQRAIVAMLDELPQTQEELALPSGA